MIKEDLSNLATEGINPLTHKLDQISTLEMVKLINAEDNRIPGLVAKATPEIAKAIDAIAERMKQGGRLIYMGAGTSGRLGVLDAVECPPTFSVPQDLVIGLVAGGETALKSPVEGAEDQTAMGERDLTNLQLTPQDSVVGISASGRTPYVLGGLKFSQRTGALAISLTCNIPSQASQFADINITIPTGPEVLTGSTRMKAGTATKMVLNLVSTGVMVRLGKTYGNLMVDVQPTNEKLRQRAIRLVQHISMVKSDVAESALEVCDWEVKTAIMTCRLGISPQEARDRLQQATGHLSVALGEV